MRRNLIRAGAIYQSTSDTEVVLHLVAGSKKPKFVDRFIEAIMQLEGAYSFVGLTNKKLIGVRDPLGIRPLVLGELDGAYILASETCALDIIGARFVRDIENGEVVIISETGIESLKPFGVLPARPCIFEYIYFALPDSVMEGTPVYETRKRIGAELARESGVPADLIVPVPDSGVPAAMGGVGAGSRRISHPNRPPITSRTVCSKIAGHSDCVNRTIAVKASPRRPVRTIPDGPW